ncbi:hypothetical protein H500_01010 [Helicobacter pylori CG-IMSS-2012]|nr:hypothetical protein H500_01010 [Helicobacter pylori CG-IMSS-2012]
MAIPYHLLFFILLYFNFLMFFMFKSLQSQSFGSVAETGKKPITTTKKFGKELQKQISKIH